jgi:peptide/nickel transport system substrate-binding protein
MISKDGTVYTFNMVHNATWHDGMPLTCDDYKFTIENVGMKTGIGVSAEFYQSTIKSVECSDAYTLVVTLKAAYAPFIKLWHTFYLGAALPKHLYEGTDILKNPLNFKPVGYGPYKFAEYVKGSYVRMVRNPNYFKAGLPYSDEVVVKIIPQSSSIVAALEKGEVSWFPSFFPQSEYERVSKNPDIAITTEGSEAYVSIPSVYFNLWDPNRSYVTNVLVRQAITQAIDKGLLVQLATAGLMKPATGPFPKFSFPWAYYSNEPYPYDVAAANKILDDAGYKRGSDGMRFSLTWVFSPYSPDIIVASEVIPQQLKQIGIDVKVVSLEVQTMIDRVFNKKDFDLYVHRWGPNMPDPSGYESLFRCKYKAQTLVGGRNPSSYCNSAIDPLWDKAASELDQAKRGDLYKQITQMMQKDVPAVWLWESVSVSGYRKEWVGLPAGPHVGCDDIGSAWWTKGSQVSPTSAAATIKNVEQQLQQLQSQMYDVTKATENLQQAKQALDSKDYAGATQLANQALGLAQPPYALYGAVIAVIIIIATTLLYYRRRKRMRED